MSNVTIERVFNLGDYKSLRVTVSEPSLPDVSNVNDGINQILDAYEIFFRHQLIVHTLNDNTTGVEEAKTNLSKLNSLRENILKNMEDQNATN